MDEYTFLVMAKLKADRFKLEREQAQSQQRAETPDTAPASSPRPAARREWSAREAQWSEQS